MIAWLKKLQEEIESTPESDPVIEKTFGAELRAGETMLFPLPVEYRKSIILLERMRRRLQELGSSIASAPESERASVTLEAISLGNRMLRLNDICHFAITELVFEQVGSETAQMYSSWRIDPSWNLLGYQPPVVQPRVYRIGDALPQVGDNDVESDFSSDPLPPRDKKKLN